MDGQTFREIFHERDVAVYEVTFANGPPKVMLAHPAHGHRYWDIKLKDWVLNFARACVKIEEEEERN